VPFDQLISRYREVTPPKGMENWHAPEFDPAKAGWKRGKSPFGQYDGKIPAPPVSKCSDSCVGPECYGATKVNTLWEKEVLLLHGAFNVPALKEGHRYRLRVNHSAHVGNGGGFAVHINGKQLIEQPNCIGRGGGEKPYGAYITKEWLDQFQGAEVTIALTSFLRFNDKYKVKPTERIPQGRISLHLEQQKLPPMGDDLVSKSAAVVAMTSSEWQAVQQLEDRDKPAGDSMFRWDGKFAANPKVTGNWKVIAQVPEIAEFDAEKKTRVNRPPFSAMTFKDGGTTADPAWAWSGDTLMDLTRYQALKINSKTIGDTDYLFVEAGGFGTRNKPEWKSSWLVLARQ